MGFADLLLKLGIRYDSSEGLDYATEIMSFIKGKAYDESSKLGKEKGNFPEFKKTKLSEKYEYLRNCQTTVIAPTGTLSLLASTSSGIEPNFSWHTEMHRMDTVMEEYHPLAKKYVVNKEKLPNFFVSAGEILPEWHIRMQAAFQAHTCSGISKTVNLPHSATKEDVAKAYMLGWELKVKGLTVYREGSRSQEVLVHAGKKEEHKNQKVMNLIYRERPEDLLGRTRKAKTGCGNSYITVNFDEDGYPIEVFKQVSSRGGCDAMAEGLARMTSLALRYGINITEIVKQLRSVKCSNAVSKNIGCLSCPDLMGRVLSDLLHQKESEVHEPKCPDCNGKLETLEGCRKCPNCGWSKCN
jgi:ribonucleoside-diphosphate reductase alpha chain